MTLTNPITIEIGELFLDTDGEYDRDTGALVTIRVMGRDVDPEPLRVMLSGLLGSELDALDGETLDRLMNEESESAACDMADHQRDLRREDDE